ncbi:MAG: hypothetical protein KC643_31555 [Nitrospira sp.]|nr:hypothetical protein [Nitrospira sp.]
MNWNDCQNEIAQCRECCSRWPDEVIRPFQVGEIPNPPSPIGVLFVGVAPTPNEGRYQGGHFYTSTQDPLRRGLFALLEEIYKCNFNALSLEEGNAVFHRRGCFFVHAAKVRPIVKAAPPQAVLRYCAHQHLRVEIDLLQTQTICFLGKNNTIRVAEDLFGRPIGEEPQTASLNHWTGRVVVAPQPRRGWEGRTREILAQILPVP